MESCIVARTQTIPRYFSTSSKDSNAVWTWKFLSGSCSWQKASGPSPIVPGFYFAELFVPSSILLPRLEIPHMLSSKECSSGWPKSLPGNEEQLCICGFFSLVASSLTAVRQTLILPELFHQPFPIGEQLVSGHLLGGPLLTSTSSLVPDLWRPRNLSFDVVLMPSWLFHDVFNLFIHSFIHSLIL